MSYPQRSNARLGLPDSLWWRARFDDLDHVCQSQIGTVLRDCQRVLRSILPRAFTVRGVLWDRDQINVDGNFGPHSFSGLVRALDDLGPPAAQKDDVLADFSRLVSAYRAAPGATGQAITWATMDAIVHVAGHRLLPWGDVAFPTDGVTALFNVDSAPEGDATDNVHCDLQSQADRQIPVIDIDVPPPVSEQGGSDNALVIVAVVAALAAAAGGGKRHKRA